jgi:cytochrome c
MTIYQLDLSRERFSEAPPDNSKTTEKIFKMKCAQCDTVDKGVIHKQGPNLHGIFGSQFGMKMVFPSLKKPQEWADLIAYLKLAS